MASLYHLANEYLAAFAEDENGELPGDLCERLDAIEADITVKAGNVVRFIQQCKGDAEMYSAEGKRLAALAAAKANQADRLKDYLMENLERAGMTKLSTDIATLSICKNSMPSVTVLEGMDPRTLPAEYQRIKVEVDAKRIGDDFKAGKPLPEGVSAAIGKHLRVR